MNVLWDFSFKKFITPKVVGIVYGIGMFIAGIMCLTLLNLGFQGGFLSGVGTLALSPIIFLGYTIIVRIYLESLVASIKIAENTLEMVENTKLLLRNSEQTP